MSDNKTLKNRFFNTGVKAYSAAFGKQNDLYYCPICASSFSHKDLDSGILTLEHVPPEAQGGREIALTCSLCNSGAGDSVDAAVTNRERVLSLASAIINEGTFNDRVVVNFNDVSLTKVNMHLVVDESKMHFHLLEEYNHPNTSALIKNFFHSHNQEQEPPDKLMKISTVKKFHYGRSKVGDLRSAFLLCFALFGYKYVFSKDLAPVRSQIKHYDEKVIGGFWLELGSNEIPQKTICIIDKPFRALSVVLGKVAVLLPWSDSPDNFFDFITQNYIPRGHVEFSGRRLPWPKTLEMRMDFLSPTDN